MAKKKAAVEMAVDKNIETQSFEDEMGQSYIDYAMSVISERALPDVRDGLKPVQRRVLYDMEDLNISHDKPHRKSARIVGDTMGRLHAHGDSSIYGTVVHMSQEWNYNHPLVDKHGNMGSIEGDGAAAMRYCVAGRSLVSTSEGLIPIEEIAGETELNSDNPIDIQVKSRNGAINESHVLFNSGEHECLLIILNNGQCLACTENHPVLIRKQGRKIWRLAKDIHPKERCVIDTDISNALFGKNDNLEEAIELAKAFDKEDENLFMPSQVLRGTRMYILTYLRVLLGTDRIFTTKSNEYASAFQTIMQTQLGILCKRVYDYKTKYITITPAHHGERIKLEGIRSIRKMKKKLVVYSLRVDSECHSFTTNSFVSHNTEVRLSKITEDAVLDGLKNDTVDFVPNFDDTDKEPALLPVKIPNLLISGSEGIAVGMACSIPTHNLGEAIEAAKLYMSRKNVTLDELLEVMPGPDFATGGIIANKKDLRDIYRTGNGKIRIRGKTEITEIDGKPCIVIKEIPATMIGRIDRFIMSIADLIRDKKAPDITNVSNMSGKEGINIIVELRKGSSAQRNLNILYKKAKLEDTFSFNMLAVEDGEPKTYSLMEYLKSFVDFQMEINTRKYKNILEKKNREREIKEGLVRAIDEIDTIIAVLRGSKNKKLVFSCLTSGVTEGIKFKTKALEKAASKLSYSELQAGEILSMQLQRLIGLEAEALQAELDECNKKIKECEGYLSSPVKMKNRIKQDMDAIKKEYAIPRKTQISDESEVVLEKQEVEQQDYYFVCDKFRYAKLLDESTYQRNAESINTDYRYCIKISNTDKLLMFTDSGKMHSIKVMQIPLGNYKAKGSPLENLSNLTTTENIVGICSLADIVESRILVSLSNGYVKFVKGSEFEVSTRSTYFAKPADGEKIICASPDTGDEVVLHTKEGFWSRFKAAEISEMGKSAKGVKGVSLRASDELTEVFQGDSKSEFESNGNTYPFTKIKLQKRGGVGTKSKL